MDPMLTDDERQTLTEDSVFHFFCDPSLPCFTLCCRDVNIYLTPYDVLRLRRALKMGSTEFLARYTRHFLDKTTSIPIVQLEMMPDTLQCKLVTARGCSVYADRPWACRMYPLDIAGREGVYRTVVESQRCLGLLERKVRTVAEWLSTQDVAPYLEMEKAFHSVMPPSFRPGSNVGIELGKLLFLAYDLDKFLELLEDTRFRTFYEIDDALFQRVRTDDEALLRLALRYIRSQMEEFYPAHGEK